MPAGHLHRRLMGGGSTTYLGLLQQQAGAGTLIAYWPLTDVYSTSSGSANEVVGTITNSGRAGTPSSITYQDAGCGWNVDGSNVSPKWNNGTGFLAGDVTTTSTTAASLSFWYRTDNTVSTASPWVNLLSSASQNWQTDWRASPSFQFRVGTAGWDNTWTSFGVSTDTPMHIGWTHTVTGGDATAKIFVNGVERYSYTKASTSHLFSGIMSASAANDQQWSGNTGNIWAGHVAWWQGVALGASDYLAQYNKGV